jgi:hypothetical protein
MNKELQRMHLHEGSNSSKSQIERWYGLIASIMMTTILTEQNKTKSNSVALSPQANYTD